MIYPKKKKIKIQSLRPTFSFAKDSPLFPDENYIKHNTFYEPTYFCGKKNYSQETCGLHSARIAIYNFHKMKIVSKGFPQRNIVPLLSYIPF